MAENAYQTLILGAGAAGLAAAADLAATGRSVLVLEARDRIGGRVWSHDEPGFPVPIELGAEFVHGRAAATFDLLQQVGAAAMDAPESHWSLRRGKFAPMEEAIFLEMQRALKSVDLRQRDISFDAFLRRSASYGLSAKGRRFARMFVEGFDAADPARVSTRSIAEEWRSGGVADSPQFRPLGGYSGLLAALVRRFAGNRVRVRLGTVVHSVRWRHGFVEMEGVRRGKPFRAQAAQAIITLPLGVLQQRSRSAGSVLFTPNLAQKQDALNGLAAGPVLKVALRFRTAFWEKLDHARYENAAFFHAPDKDFPTFWTALPLRVPLLMAWTGGPRAEHLSGASQTQIIDRALRSAHAAFGRRCNVRGQLAGAWCHNWQRDAFARGAYSYVVVGGGAAHQALAAPLDHTLFFAGEATDENESGTVAGALQSGRRAAREIIENGATIRHPRTG